jgi:hypothetical protein
MLIWVPWEEIRHRLTSNCSPWIATLPEDYEIVESHVDAGRDALRLVVRSRTFPRIARGTPIPEFPPEPAPPGDRTPFDGRLAVLWVPGRDLAHAHFCRVPLD